jgi:hypothetical protein
MLEALSFRLSEIVESIGEVARKYELLCQKRDPKCDERNFMIEVEDVLRREVWDSWTSSLSTSIGCTSTRASSVGTTAG